MLCIALYIVWFVMLLLLFDCSSDYFYLEGTTAKPESTTPTFKNFLASLSDEELLFLENAILTDDFPVVDPPPSSPVSPLSGMLSSHYRLYYAMYFGLPEWKSVWIFYLYNKPYPLIFSTVQLTVTRVYQPFSTVSTTSCTLTYITMHYSLVCYLYLTFTLGLPKFIHVVTALRALIGLSS